jgi:hypothetical protein
MANVRVVPRSLTDAYKRREGDFAPNLVGLQFTDGASLFTFGNFQITTNLDRKLNKNFVLGGQWSDYYNLSNLNLTQNESEILLSNEIFVRLNFNPRNIDRYVYFGSFYEFAKVTIESIIQKWKGSLYLNPTLTTNFPVNTVLSFNYNSAIDVATFLIPKSVIGNPFELIVDANTDFVDIKEGEIFNISRDYNKYVIWNGLKNFDVIEYTGSTTSFEYLRVKTKGNPFPTLTASTFGQLTYHFKPNDTEVELFFNELSDFEKLILNRLTTPIYTSTFDVPTEFDGVLQILERSYTWPVTDGYNLDINTPTYQIYLEGIFEMATQFDKNKTDLVARRFVSESIMEYDTTSEYNPDTPEAQIYGRKVNKLLRIYGREFDEVKKYIDGISFANVVTYNKLDNTSDELIKIIAKNLGFDVLLTVGTDNFNLLEQIKPSYDTPFSGYSRSLSSIELDIELWRRLVINAWWLFRSKGTRKVIEFFFNLFKIPGCMVTLNEYIYLAENRLDPIKVNNQLKSIFESIGLDGDDVRYSDYPIDVYGFPRILPETNDNYFQMGGFWYNGGNESTIGNNPHIGPYDFGKSYFNQFECFVPDFNNFLTGSTLVDVSENYFNNYNEGTFIFDQNGLPVPYYGTGYANALNTDGLVDNAIVNSAGLTYVGGNNSPNYGRPSGDTYSMKISFTAGSKGICDPCSNYELVFGPDGIVYYVKREDQLVPLEDALCCKNYWLPITVNTPVCPNVNEMMISTEGVILDSNTNLTIPQECCKSELLGFNVFWDGRKCINFDLNKACPSNTIISVDGVVLDPVKNQTVPEECCTLDVLGFNATWNGTNCVIRTGLDTSGLGLDMGEKSYTMAELLQGNERTPTDQEYLCYWCPPNEYIQTICNVDEYLATLTTEQVISLAQSLGLTNNDYNTSVTFLSNLYTPFFNTYGCLILDNKDDIIKDKACCELRGGVLTNVNGTNYCIKLNTDCAGSQVSPGTHVWVTPNNTLVSQSCCNQNGQYWVSPISPDDNNITLITQNGTTTFLDIPGFTYAQSSSYCSACPNNLINSVTSTGTFITDSNNNSLTQQCCIDYGFSWDQNTSKCTACPTVVNYGTPLDDNVITNLNGDNLSQQCCTQVGGYYNDTNGQGAKCYICPPFNLFNNVTGVPEPNTNYQIINGEVLYLGNTLTQQCCINYNTEFGNVTWNGIERKCLVNIL